MKFYICTAISYVNAAPHIGHALEFIQADALSRYHRLRKDRTFFLTGTDEHGVKIYETAKEAGIDTSEFVDRNAQKYIALKDQLHLSYDDFIRTTSERHKAGVTKIWKKMEEAGDIYKGIYKGNYCVGCEAFIPDKDLVDGKCPIHQKVPQILEEENYFFKLSRYSDQIKKMIESDEVLVLPESRKKEMLNIIGEEGLKDVSFSRPKNVLPWGIPVPGDDTQVMYVWCDALSNYITAIDYENEGELFKELWPCDVQLIGKDILRFHAGIWIGMLISAGIVPPKAIYVHGFVTSEGQKMSKSLGNVVDPLAYIEKYGTDALRYYLLREIPTMDDGDFSHSRFVDVYNSELANSLGNLVNRVLTMVQRYSDSKIPPVTSGEGIVIKIEDIFARYGGAFAAFDLKAACECVVELTDFANKYIDDTKPWALAKEENSEKLSEVLYNLLEILRFLDILLIPLLPEPANKIAACLGLQIENLTFEKTWGILKEGTEIKVCEVIFPRIEE